MMSLTEIYESVKYVVDSQGKHKAVQLDIAAWESLREILEEIEDERLGQLMREVKDDERLEGDAAQQAYQAYVADTMG
jgi:predicted DNA-binding ribbon-helix-helix protein